MTEMPRPSDVTEMQTLAPEPLPGLVWAFRIHADGTAEALPANAPIEMHHDGWLWLHFNLADARTADALKSFKDFPEQATDVLMAPDDHQHLFVDQASIYGVFADLIYGLDGTTREIGFLHFALNERLLISTRRHAMTAAEQARQQLLGGCKLTCVASLLELIVEQVIQSIDRYADRLLEEMSDIEVELLGRDVKDLRQKLTRIRRAAVHLHRQLIGLHALFQRYGKELDSEVRPNLRIPAVAVQQRLQGLDHDIVALRDRAHLLQEEVSAKIAEETNRSLHVLTIITTYFLPASLVAGIFGMNTKGLPLTDVDGGFYWSLLILIGSPLLISILLWRLRAASR
jgi:zinc transporter